MPACEGTVFVITAGGVAAIIAAIGGLLGALGAAYGLLFRETIKPRDNQIIYLQNLNSDLTEIAKPALGVASGAVAEVRDRRRQAGR